MHVLLTTDVVGGVWDFCCTLAAELVRTGGRATLLALGEPSEQQRDQARATGAQVLHEDLKLEWMAGSEGDVQRSRQLLRDLRKLRPDIVHANQFALGSVELDMPLVLTAHSDVLSWHKWALGRRPGPEWDGYAALVRDGLQGADRVTAVSGFLARELIDLYGVSRDIHVIHNGWNGGLRPSLEEIRHRDRLSMLAGRAWDAGKNLALAARALEGWDAGEVVFAGDMTHPEGGSADILARGIGWLGRLSQPELLRWLRRARLYVSPAKYDPFGLLPLQAALAGCALLLSDIPSYRELWDGAAMFFDPADAADLRVRWAQLLDDDEAAARVAQRCRDRARERFGAARMAAEYARLYESLAANRMCTPELAVAP
ncbi:MAG TPA: glycosyltransferase family 4 protein [Chloroflexota bacterium]|nr:glycosyltransferase family 4 protein [Chloroflexota bacterium]